MPRAPSIKDLSPLAGLDLDPADEARRADARGLPDDDQLDEELDLSLLLGLRSILPDIPAPPGFKYTWLSTTNTGDPLTQRRALGYEPVRRSDLDAQFQGFGRDASSGAIGDDEYVVIRDAMLHRIRSKRWQQIMGYFHNTMPANSERAVLASTAQAVAVERPRERAVLADGGLGAPDSIFGHHFSTARGPIFQER